MNQRLKKQILKVLPFDIAYQFDKAFQVLGLNSHGNDQTRDDRFIQAFMSASCGMYNQAAVHFNDLAQAYPAYGFVAYFHAGLCGLLSGHVADAAIAFDCAMNLRTDDFWTRIYAGAVCHVMGLVGRANAHWFAAIKIDCNDLTRYLFPQFITDDHHPERLALFPLCRGKGIDVGCGHRKTHPDAIGIDLVIKGEVLNSAANVAGRLSQADIKATGDQLSMFGDNSLDYVIQRHNLEHYQDPIRAIQEWKRILKPGGILAMVVPDDDVCDSIHLDPSHKHVFTQSSLFRIIELIGGMRVVHMGPLLFRWSFICVIEKAMEQDCTQLDYLAVMKKFESDQIRRKAYQYQHSGLDLLAEQCLKFMRSESTPE
jgi:predicted SAM-dependent methyltransferase